MFFHILNMLFTTWLQTHFLHYEYFKNIFLQQFLNHNFHIILNNFHNFHIMLEIYHQTGPNALKL